MFGKNSLMTSGANMTANDSAKMALQTLLFAELRQASQARGERAKLLSAAFVGVIVGAVICGANMLFPFIGN